MRESLDCDQCEFKDKNCPKTIETPDGTQSVWHLLSRLSNRGKSDSPIDTRTIGSDFLYKQNSPATIAELFSQQGWQYCHIHNCAKCKAATRNDLVRLEIIDDED